MDVSKFLFYLKKIVLTISLKSSSNPECKVSIGDQLEVIWG